MNPLARHRRSAARQPRLPYVAISLAIALVLRREFFIRQRGLGQYDQLDQYAVVEIIIVALTSLYLLLVPGKQLLLNITRQTSLGPFFLFAAVGIGSAAWSENPPYSLFFGLEFAVESLLLLFIASRFIGNLRRFESRAISLFLAVTLIGLAYKFGRYGVTEEIDRYKGNAYSASAAMLAAYCFAELFSAEGRRRIFLLVMGGIGVGLVALATGAASIVSMAFGMTLAPLVTRGQRWPLVVFVGTGLLFGLLYAETAMQMLFPGKTQEQILNLHGRTRLWMSYLELIQEQPWLGYGYSMAAKLDVQGAHAHNSIFSIVLGTGLLGLSLFAFFLFRLGVDLRETLSRKLAGSAGCTCAIGTGLLNSMTISYLGEDWRGPSLVLVTMMVTTAVMLYAARGLERQRRWKRAALVAARQFPRRPSP